MLTEEQISCLYEFCLQKRVYYYEIQTELVDHLANAIEAAIVADPEISFEKALHNSYDAFGMFGFSPIVRQKTRQIRQEAKRQFRVQRNALITWIGLAEVLVISSVFLLFVSWNVVNGQLLVLAILSLLVVRSFYESRKLNRTIKRTGKEFWTARFISVGFPGMGLFLLISYLASPVSIVINNHYLFCLAGAIGVKEFQAYQAYVGQLRNQLKCDFPKLFKF